jgi:hypothetical protein
MHMARIAWQLATIGSWSRARRRFAVAAICTALFGCGGSGDSAPAGSCKTGGTATGSYVAACNECAAANCAEQLKEKAGSGWAMQYFGGDGACAGFNGCLCQCLAANANPVACLASSECAAKLDAPCAAAVKAAQDCLAQHCASTCR